MIQCDLVLKMGILQQFFLDTPLADVAASRSWVNLSVIPWGCSFCLALSHVHTPFLSSRLTLGRFLVFIFMLNIFFFSNNQC